MLKVALVALGFTIATTSSFVYATAPDASLTQRIVTGCALGIALAGGLVNSRSIRDLAGAVRALAARVAALEDAEAGAHLDAVKARVEAIEDRLDAPDWRSRR